MYYFLAIIFATGAFAIRYIPRTRKTAYRDRTTGDVVQREEPINFPFKPVQRIAQVAAALFLAVGVFQGAFFYAQPGYIYHVRTLWGSETAVDKTGFSLYGFGYVNPWKKCLSVQSDTMTDGELVSAEADSESLSASLPPLNLVFLDQVDADVTATARFCLPTDNESFLPIAREYRSADNLLRTSLIPAFKETLEANASLMTAEEYFSGARTEFNRDFEDQLKNGVYLVKRIESKVRPQAQAKGTADASRGTNQVDFAEDEQVITRVEKIQVNGQYQRKIQAFGQIGITVVEARVTNVDPNTGYKERMKNKQVASADRAVAREQRIQEEERQLLAVAKGDREVAERQAAMKVDQIERTTKQETEKAIALIEANRQKEQAEIERETAAIQLERDQIRAQSVQVLADAAAYEREALLQADNALQMKLDTEVQIQKVWADAFAKRQVPQNLWLTGDTKGDSPAAGNTELTQIMQLMTMQLADRLDYSRAVDERK